jgi:small subunit ribosomal protein S1
MRYRFEWYPERSKLKKAVMLMSAPNTPESPFTPETTESFGDLLSQYEKSHIHKLEASGRQLEATVITVSPDYVFLDIGYKVEGALPVAALQGKTVKPGDQLTVSVKGRSEEGYYNVTLFKIAQPTDWESLERAFNEKSTITGTVTGVVKGGLTVDIGVRAFMPASRSGVRETADMEKLVGQEIRCRITKLEVQEENVVVDRRVIIEEEERVAREHRYTELQEGDTVTGTVRSLADYGAFVDLGGVDGLLHIGDISWARVHKASDVLAVGQQVEVRVLKIDAEKKRISLGLKQLKPQPWESVPDKYKTGDRVRGTVTRLADFGAFVEIEPGVEGLIHISEMSWVKKVRKPGDLVKVGDAVDAVVLGINLDERRISLGLKQALGSDPWAEAAQRMQPGSVVEGPVTSFTKFGAFVQAAEGVEGMVHISEIVADRRLNHPQDALKLGQVVKAQVLEIDKDKRQLKLSIKQLIPTSLEEYIADHKEGDVVTGRMVEETVDLARIELGEGVFGTYKLPAATPVTEQSSGQGKVDLSAFSSMLQARWKGGSATATTTSASKPEPIRIGQIRSFRISKLDPTAKRIDVELA